MLNYGELQILELLKNTLPSRIYPILFPVDNLRDMVTTAKRVLTKEDIDRQKSGESSAAPFMRVSKINYSTMKASKKGVTFEVMETIERSSDSIDKLMSLVSKMNMKMEEREAPYKPQIYKGRPSGQSRNRQKIIKPAIDHSVGIRIKIEIQGTTAIETILGQILGIDLGTTIGMIIEEITTSLMIDKTITDKTTRETIIGKKIEWTKEIGKIMEEMNPNTGIEIDVRVDRDQEITIVTILEVEMGVETD